MSRTQLRKSVDGSEEAISWMSPAVWPAAGLTQLQHLINFQNCIWSQGC